MLKNVLMILLDCARSEKTIVDLPGATPGTRRSAPLPFLEYLRGEGTTWAGYHAVSSTTTPNVATMFTGLLPVQHGIQEHSRYGLLPDVPTLAEHLRRAGYHTRAEFTGPLVAETGLDRGFDVFRYRERTDYLLAGFADHLGRVLLEMPTPWFLVVHLWEAHQPYQNPPPFNGEENGSTPYDRALSLADHVLHALLKRVDLQRTSVVYCGDHGERIGEDWTLHAELGGPDAPVAALHGRFTVECGDDFGFDAWFEHCRRELGEITARIYAHSVLGHGFHLTEDLIRTPLVIADGERCRAGIVRPELSTQADLFATVLDLAGVEPTDEAGSRDRSLLGERVPEKVYLEANGSGGMSFASRCYLRGARNERFKYWRLEAPGLEQRVLWDLESDPRETRDVAASHPDVCEDLDRFVDECLRDRRSDDVDLNRAEAAVIESRLRDLGYL